IDLRDTEAQRPEPIPKGVYCLEIEVKGGSAGREDCLRVAKNQRSPLLVLECTVIGGTYNGRKVWDYITVDLDESDRDDVPPIPSDKLEGLRTSVRMGRNRVRAIVDSANGLHPSDHSAATDAKRLLESYEALDGLRIYGQVDIRPATAKYAASNCLDFVVTIEDPSYPKEPAKVPAKGVVQLRRTATADPDDEIPFALAFFIISAVAWLVAGGSTLIA